MIYKNLCHIIDLWFRVNALYIFTIWSVLLFREFTNFDGFVLRRLICLWLVDLLLKELGEESPEWSDLEVIGLFFLVSDFFEKKVLADFSEDLDFFESCDNLDFCDLH